jgi:L-ascorbate metabolism protein UlaG (beta-lactamase superfamily)
VRIKWFGHATFLVEGDGLRIITDPFTPEVMNLSPVTESADIVIRSSADDDGHNCADMIAGNPLVVTATEIGAGTIARGLHVAAIPVQESLIHKTAPLDNAIYSFTVEGIHLAHMGDAGNRLTETQLNALQGTEILFALAGGPPTIDIDDLMDAIKVIQPRVIIPMHYDIPGLTGNIFPVNVLTDRFPRDAVRRISGSEVEFSRATLPTQQQVVVLEPVCGPLRV